jgi:hypothetical protein
MVEVFCAIALRTWRCPGGDLAVPEFGRDPQGRTSRDAPCRDVSRRFLEGLVSQGSTCRDVSVRLDLHGGVTGIPASVRLWKCMRT